jgi:hypothetical protein
MNEPLALGTRDAVRSVVPDTPIYDLMGQRTGMYAYPAEDYAMRLGRLKSYVLELTIRAVPTEVSEHFPLSLPATTLDWSEVVSAYLLKHVQQEGKQTSLYGLGM